MKRNKTGPGDRIRRAREEAGLTQGAVAAELDVDASEASRWENGERSPGSRAIDDVPADRLIGRSSDLQCQLRASVVQGHAHD